MCRTEDKIATMSCDREIELPVVIRPPRLRLADLERRAQLDDDFASALATRSAFRALLAHALHARDADARARFADVAALALHLQAMPRARRSR